MVKQLGFTDMAERIVSVPNMVVPNPDPSEMTAKAIDRQVLNTEKILSARLDAMDKAITVFNDNLTRVPTQLDRGIGALRDLIEAKIMSIEHHMDSIRTFAENEAMANKSLFNTRFSDMAKAIELIRANVEERPAYVREQIGLSEKLMGERFDSVAKDLAERDKRTSQSLEGINTQFSERDKRTEQLSLADKTAIAAALQAQKEAAGATNESNGAALAKMEGNFTKQIEAGQTNLTLMSRNLEDKLNDLKSRMDRGEGKSNAVDPAMSSRLDMLANAVSDLNRSRDQHSGSEGQASASSTRMFSIIAIMVAGAVGIAEVLTRLTH